MGAQTVAGIGRWAARVVVAVAACGVGVTGARAQNPPEEIDYYATDALGSVRIVFTQTGQVIGRSDYLPFGETLNQSGALPLQRFTGQERDGEAGMDYFNARNLQARTGRMNAPDPLFGDAVTNPQRWNRYAYVANSPLRFTDPSGMQYKAQTVGYSCSLTNCVSLPAQEMSDAAKEGSVDLIVSGVNATFGGENLGAGGVMPGHQFRPHQAPGQAAVPQKPSD